MHECGYPYSAEHRKLHQSFVDKSQYFYTGIKNFPLLLSNEIACFLRDWITAHTRVVRCASGG